MYEYIDWMYSLFLAQLAGLDHNIRQLEVFRYSRSLPFTNNLTSITHARSVTKWHSPITTTTISVSHYNKNIHCISMVCVCLFWCIGWTSGSSILWKRNLSGVHIWISSLFFFLINALIQFIFDSSQLTTTTIEKTYVFWFLCVHSRTLRARFLLLHSLKCYINKKRFSSISRKQQARNEKSYMRERKENARGWSGVCARGKWDVRSERRWRQSARKIRTEQPTDKSPERRRRRVFVYAKRVSEREWAGVDRVSEIGLYWRWWSLLFASYLILLLLLFLVYCRASIQSKPAHVRRFNFGWFLFSFFFLLLHHIVIRALHSTFALCFWIRCMRHCYILDRWIDVQYRYVMYIWMDLLVIGRWIVVPLQMAKFFLYCVSVHQLVFCCYFGIHTWIAYVLSLRVFRLFFFVLSAFAALDLCLFIVWMCLYSGLSLFVKQRTTNINKLIFSNV